MQVLACVCVPVHPHLCSNALYLCVPGSASDHQILCLYALKDVSVCVLLLQAMMKACGGHKNVVELIQFAEFGLEMYFVMEYCPSTLLRSVLEENEVCVVLCIRALVSAYAVS